ncbi:MAG: acetylxylan esterase [Bacteroidales bacterium]|nr:acetylxylan esterase [Bacteroidales bacterium]
MNKTLTKTAISFLLICTGFAAFAQNLLPQQWKFSTGDEITWSDPAFDDSGWITLSPERVWEQQGFGSYDGIAWYRVTFVIPSSYKKYLGKKGSFLLNLGMIDDCDETYFNGKIIGTTGTFPPETVTAHDKFRSYEIAWKLVRWDKPNTLAIRVFDGTGNGGIYAGPPALVIKELFEKISIIPQFKKGDHVFSGEDVIKLPITVENKSGLDIDGIMNVRITNQYGDQLENHHQPLRSAAGSETETKINLDRVVPGFYKASVKIESGLFMKQMDIRFGYEPEKIVSKNDRPTDFEEFWSKAKADLKNVDPRYKLIRIDSLCTPSRNIYLVEMHSLGDVLIRGWYSVPSAPGKYPAILQVQGYSSTIFPSYVNYGDDIIGFGINIRGHGNSKDDVNPGFPGFLLYHLDNKDEYIYRGAYMDCLRAVDFLFSRNEVDTTRVGVEGASQGGALTFATAALAADRIAVCAPQVPFLSDFPNYFKVAAWPANEFTNYVEVEKKQSWEQVYRTLSYFDIKNLAPMIKAPMLMGVGLCDEVCPPVINFAAFNNVQVEKSYVVYPEAGHSLPDPHYALKMKWFRENFNLPSNK